MHNKGTISLRSVIENLRPKILCVVICCKHTKNGGVWSSCVCNVYRCKVLSASLTECNTKEPFALSSRFIPFHSNMSGVILSVQEDRKAGGYRSTPHSNTEEEENKFEEIALSESDHEDQTPLTNILKDRGIFARYVYPCDAMGRVIGDRLPTHTTFQGCTERILVVGQHQEHFFYVRKNQEVLNY